MEFEVAEEQAGFRQGRGTQNHLCNLRILTKRARARAHKQPLFLCFIAIEKAFDTVSHKKLWRAMLDMGFAPHLVALIKSLYSAQWSNVRVHGQTSDWFTVLKGVRQGLFTLAIPLQHTSWVVDACGTRRLLWRILNRWEAYKQSEICRWHCVGRKFGREAQELVSRVYGAAKDAGMRINVRKTEVMKVCENAPYYLGSLAQIPWSEVQCSGTWTNGEVEPAMAKSGYKPLFESATHSVPGMAHTHIRRWGLDPVQGFEMQYRGFRDAVLLEEYEDFIHRTCYERRGSGTGGAEQEVARNGEDSQTEVLWSLHTPH